MLVPAPSIAAEQGWVPVVAKAGKAVSPQRPRAATSVPPVPRAKPPTTKKAAPAASGAGKIVPPLAGVARASAPSGTDEISTGSVEPLESTRTLSPEDTARVLFAEADDSPLDEGRTVAGGIQGSDLARGYCVSIADAAADARIAWQKAKLAEVEQELGKRIAALEAKTAEYKAWLERRDAFLRRATEALVQIYTQMEPDAAALQLAAMDEETAAAVLTKLDPRNSGAILSEMQPDKAARLTATIAGAARVPTKNSGPAAAAARPGGATPEDAKPDEGRS